MLLPPSSKLSAGCLSNPATPRLITAISSAHKGARFGHQETLGTLQQSSVSHCLLAFPLLSLSLLADIPTYRTTCWFSPPSCWPWPLFPHPASLQHVVIHSHLSRFWSGVFLTSRYKDPRLVPSPRKNSPSDWSLVPRVGFPLSSKVLRVLDPLDLLAKPLG